MSTTHEITTPPAPPVVPPTGGGGGGGGEPEMARVSRNNPPKRVMVNAGTTVTYGGKTYTEGEMFLMQGPEADAFAFDPAGAKVSIVSHEEIDAWNGKEGRDQAAAALSFIDHSVVHQDVHQAFNAYLRGEATPAEMHKQIGDAKKAGPERTHDHGFGKYTHADKHMSIPMDLTQHRQQLAAEQMYDPQKPDEMSDDQAGLGQKE